MMQDDLIRRAMSGDQGAFQQLVESYSAIGWRTARVLLSNHSLVEDVLQEAWIDAWRGLPRFQQDRPFRPWLLAIIANRCRMAIRHQSISTVPLEHISIDEVIGDDGPLESLLLQETGIELQDILADLPIEQQRVLELRFFAELDLAEIALIIDTPLGTVKSRLHRALHTLRTQLQMTTVLHSHMEEKR
jgi:RNA polymerase sigma-70 factor (ECF subfamily)